MDNMSVSLGKRQLSDSIWKATGIEGLGTTFGSTEAILENTPVMTTAEEVYFVCNMKRAWEFVFENVDYPTNLMFVRQLNKIAMENLSYDAGNVRTVPVSIGGTSWKPKMPNSAEISEDLRRITSGPDALESALDVFCYLCRTQAFLDGNKRMAQLVSNKVMMENDLGIISVPHDRVDHLKDLLVKYYESGDDAEVKGFLREECLLLVGEKSPAKDEEEEEENEPRI